MTSKPALATALLAEQREADILAWLDSEVESGTMRPERRRLLRDAATQLRELRAERDAYRTQAINRGWNWNLYKAYGAAEYERQLATSVDRAVDVMLGRKTLVESFRDDGGPAS